MSLSGYIQDLTGKGEVITRQANNPGAGNNFLETVPDGERWLPLGCTFLLLTDANTDTRKTDVTFIGSGGIVKSQDFSDFPLANANTGNYSYNKGAQNSIVVPPSGSATINEVVALSDVWLLPNELWTIGSGNIQVGDQFQDIILHYLLYRVNG